MVLVVDDDVTVAGDLRTELSSHQVQVESVTDATAAIAALNAQPYCGLILDLVLEKGSGFDVLDHIVKNRISIPIVVLTGKLPSYVREMLDAERVKLVIPKPVEPRLLAAIVLGLCGIPA
ncbi:MAG TPA: response regulator [Thermoanaerobaculia bacterium]|nr:response regulator [Thermoanaerobaculia bacterium]